MSRIGKAPINVPSGVDVSINGATITVKGPKGTLSRTLVGGITVRKDDNVRTMSVVRAVCTDSAARWSTTWSSE